MLRIEKLTYQYPQSSPLLFPDFKVEAGQAFLICGDSGCGKTTLLHILAGLKRPKSGQVNINGEEISNLSSARMDQFRGQNIGIVYQKPYFIESLSVKDNLMISPYGNQKDKVYGLASRLNIQDLLGRYPNQLSVGQQQRATIARAVMNTPKLILADEPTSSLDNRNCQQVLNLLVEVASTNNAALVIVTHDDRLKSEIKDYVELSPLAN